MRASRRKNIIPQGADLIRDPPDYELSPRGSALSSGFSAFGIAGWVTLTGSDPAMLSSRPCSSFSSFGLLERFRLILGRDVESAPRFFVAG